VLILIVACFVVGLTLRGGGSSVIFGVRLRMSTLYTPMLVLTALITARLLLAIRPRFELNRQAWSPRLLHAILWGGIVAAVLLSPVLYAFGDRFTGGQMPPTYWRSSPPGVDLLSYLLPNPNHALWGAPMRALINDWSGRADGFPEFAASLPWTALAVIVFAWVRTGFRLTGIRVPLTLGWLTLALGPFVHVAGFDTNVPTPWALLRYVPIISLARSPARFTVIVTAITAVLVAMTLAHVCRHYPARRRTILATIGVLLAVELWPMPRTLYSAEIPAIFQAIRDDPRPDVRVLGLPLGVRDGASSVGNYSARSQFHQTLHGKALVGGYLSRVSSSRKRLYRQSPVLNALMTLSEKTPLTPEQDVRARAGADAFIARSRLGFVVVNHEDSPDELVRFATDLLGLKVVATDGQRTIYVPRTVDAPAEDTDEARRMP
jgi:hypothetical protein